MRVHENEEWIHLKITSFGLQRRLVRYTCNFMCLLLKRQFCHFTPRHSADYQVHFDIVPDDGDRSNVRNVDS